jgi:hypothetical protein
MEQINAEADGSYVMSYDAIRGHLLHKLSRHGYWGGRHTAFENLKKGFKPRHLGAGGTGRVDEVAEDLIREGLLLQKPTGSGRHVCLNPRRSNEIQTIIDEYVKT